MPNFMDLPREIRDIVYEKALCVKGSLAPYKEGYHVPDDYDGPAPALTILATSKQIRDEALPVLYGKNTWRVTSGAPYPPSLNYNTMVRSQTIFLKFGHLIRKVVIDYSFQESSSQDRTWDVEDAHQHGTTQEQRLDILHEAAIDGLTASWDEKNHCLSGMDNLTSIAINIKNLYCLSAVAETASWDDCWIIVYWRIQCST